MSASEGLTAQDIYDGALKRNAAYQLAAQRLVEAKARVGEMLAQSRLQPTFGAPAAGFSGHLDDPPSKNSFSTYGASLTLPLPNFGKASAQAAQARAQMSVAEMELHRSRLDLAFRSNDAYYGLLRARGATKIAEE